jgi:DNA polymerase-3 subunit delta
LLAQIRKSSPAAVYLFLGPETHQRDECRRALVEAVLSPEEREEGLARHDLEEVTLAAVLDDASSLSLFTAKRVIWVSRSEAAVPKAKEEDSGGEKQLQKYVRNPTPGVVLVFDSSRFDFDGEDKTRSERVRKFFGPVKDVVEFPRWSTVEVRRLAQELARKHGLRIGAEELNLIVEAVGGSAARVAVELEKLALYAEPGQAVTADALARLVPQAQATTIFALVTALGRNDRKKALDLVDVLVREGEYLPVVLQLLAAQFRQALAAQEAGLRTAQHVQGFFAKQGVPMWPSRAEQIAQTAARATADQLCRALEQIASADRALKDIRPDDRLVMERFVMSLMQ